MGFHWKKRLALLGCAVLLIVIAVAAVLAVPGSGKKTEETVGESSLSKEHNKKDTDAKSVKGLWWNDFLKSAHKDGSEDGTGDRTGGGSSETETGDKTGSSGTETGSKTGSGDKTGSSGSGTETGSKIGNGDKTGSGTGNKNGNTGAALPALAVEGTSLVDGQGNPVQLKGISTHGLAWYPGYVNADCFKQLKEEWGIDVIRLAMYTGEYGGYCSGGDKDGLKSLVRDGVKYATDCGLYVIIDWHILSDGNPNTYIEDSKAFFSEMSREYAEYTNVLYEICNEPNGGTSWSDVKTYAEQIISVIRENDEDGIILVGTPNWCQYVDQAAADPIKDCKNVMYTLHFYAATHTESLRNTMVNAINAGLPIFVSEYGICDASGSGAIDRNQADQWVSLMNRYGVSYVAWNLSNKGETSALVKSSCNKLSGFKAEDLSDSGKWLYSMLTGENSDQAGASWSGGGTSGGGSSGGTGAPTQSGQNPGQGSQTGSGNTQTAITLTDKSGLEVTAVVVNSWEQDGKECCQYTLTITNPTDTDCTAWTVELDFSGTVSLDSSWNGNYQVEGSRLTISSMDYNGAIPAGGSVGDVGFIVRGDKGFGL